VLIDKKLIIEAKEKLGDKSASIIAENLEVENWDEINLKGSCPFGHIDETPSFIWNPKANNFHCFSCGRNYSIIDHYIEFYHLTFLGAIQRLFKETDIKYYFGEQGVKTERDYKYPFYDMTEDRSDVEEYLQLRGITSKTLDWADIQQDAHKNIVFNYYDNNDVLSLVKYRPSHKITKGENKMWCQKNSDTMPLLFNMNRVNTANGALLLTEGEIDCLSAIEAGYTNSVSVPFGSNNFGWIQTNWDWLEEFDKIIVWSDSDKPGQEMRREVCARLGIWRTLFVDAPTKVLNKDGEEVSVKDINEILYYCGKQKVLDLINDAKELPITGIEDLSSVEDFNIELAPGLYLNLEPIDNTVYKLLFGSVVLVTGKRGAGKSSFVNQCFVCEPLDQGQDIFYFSGELSPSVLKSWIEVNMAGFEKTKMKNEFVHVIDAQAKKEMREWYKNRIWVYNENDNSSETILNKAVSVIRRYGVKVIILDNLMTINLSANEKDLLLKQKEFINKLNKMAILYNVLIVLVCHPKKTPYGQELASDDISGSGDLGNLAQYIFSVKRFSKEEKDGIKGKNGTYVKGKEPINYDVEINTMKNRYTGKVSKEKLYFNYKSRRFYSKPSELWRRYHWNKDQSPLPTHDPDDHGVPDWLKD